MVLASVVLASVALAPVARRPWAMAHTLPAQPSGFAVPATTRSGRPASAASLVATSAVPSVLPSSTRTALSGPG